MAYVLANARLDLATKTVTHVPHTTNLPSNKPDRPDEDPFLLQCYTETCSQLSTLWAEQASSGKTWAEMLADNPECSACQAERTRRCRLVKEHDPRVLQEPFLSAPYVHQNNLPKYHAMLLRAVEWAKRSGENPQQILWVRAQDTPCNSRDIGSTPEAIDKKLVRFLHYHDQKTEGIPGIFPSYQGLQIRVTEKIKKSRKAGTWEKLMMAL